MKQYCLDTNILVGFLTRNDDTLLNLLRSHTAVVPLPIWLELVFVLEKVYLIPRKEIVEGLESLLADDRLIADKTQLSQIIFTYLNHTNLSIIDCFLYVFSSDNNLELITQDKKLSHLSQP